MPRGQKSELRAREKRRQARSGTQGLTRAQAAAAEEEAASSSSPPPLGVTTQRKPGAKSRSTLKSRQRALGTTTKPAGVSPTRSYKGAKGKIEKKHSSSQAPVSAVRSRKGPLRKTASVLVQFLMHMYKKKKPVMKAHMLKIIAKKYQNRYLEILRRASFSMEVVFGVDLKEVDPTKHSYTFVSKMALPSNGTMSCGRGFPKTGLLMHLLGVILMKGNCATEENVWEFLNKMRVYAGKRHFIFGEPKKLITQDLVKLKYLEYRQVANSDPARYEFLWGPRAHAETSKMKVLEFLAKINHTVPSAFQSWYEEALKDEEERAQASGCSSVLSGSSHTESGADSALCG
ncbi:melanoma-associated antigen B3-like [Eubalaena glacialis]|uniref:melanoma-associated antigen B3-like n=1 Tax=Eubalaena glacialis TaxID=27606 RepID=UPI002A5B105A|nr:melanoma-associated antigen B3-like [Eubalaena glacialis]XP_061033682.1 melanoma-associated antigen B3-like [Eubalaena glacialis]